MTTPFIHLHTHSHYSLLDGLSKIDEMVALAKKHKMPALALTDHGNLYGAIEFYKACKDAKIKPIIGVEAYITPGSRHDKRPNIDTERYHLTLLAKNYEGYRNLVRLVTLSHLEGYYYKPRIDKELLRKYSSGIIALSGCFGGELSRALSRKNIDEGKRIIKEHQEIFGKENYFIEIMTHPGVPGLPEVRKDLIALAREEGVPLVGTQDSHYLEKGDQRAHETLLAIQTNGDMNDENRFSMAEDFFDFIDTKTALERFSDIPEAVENTMKIADMCDIEIPLGSWVFPELNLPPETDPDIELRRLCVEGLPKRKLPESEEVMSRLEYELGIIKGKGYAPYFLVVADLVRYARTKGILTNIRGSVAGSLVTYLCLITDVDPLLYKIPFERFLNPDRPSAPDIDMDFADDRRDEMIEYAKEKYGADKVAQIGTFGTMLAKGAVRDVARALGYPYAIGDEISKLIPLGSQGFPMTIERAMELEPDLKEKYKNDATTKEIIDLAKRLEGCVRHISVHAAGVVIAPGPLIEYVPTQFDPKGGKIITQYDMYAVEDAGLLKFDFLGITNLAMLEYAKRIVRKTRGVEVDFDTVPVDDAKTFEILARGETAGLFQLNGEGMTKFLKDLKPTTIHDINAMVALYRPGPMQFIPEYIARKHNPKLISYADPALEKILKPTYGILVYQDDLLIMAHDLAGYSWGEVDKFRKAVGKKIPEEMAQQKEKFIKGCMETSKWSEKKATEIWAWIEPFAAYGFNKAHSVSYGRIAYLTAYMKANFPVEYMAAVLTGEAGVIEKITEAILECKRMGILVLPPHVNESFEEFAVVKDTNNIRFGLYSVKNLGADIAHAIIEERKNNGAFVSLGDFLSRITHKNLNRKSLEALIQAGALDGFGERGMMLGNIENALEFHKNANGPQNQTSLFGEAGKIEFRMKEMPPATQEEKLSWEKELLGLYVSGHPLEKWRSYITEKNISIQKVKNEYKQDQIAVIAGIVEELKPVMTKKGEHMAFLRIADFDDSIETVLFPKTFTEARALLLKDKCIAIKGRVSLRNGSKSVIAEAVKELI